MMRVLFSIFAMLMMAPAVLADHPQKHYEAERPKDYSQALQQLQRASDTAMRAHKKGDLRQMHEASYELEAALEVMQQELGTIAQQVEVMHKASERKQAAKAEAALNSFAPKVRALSKHP